jgi:hypothetical protein
MKGPTKGDPCSHVEDETYNKMENSRKQPNEGLDDDIERILLRIGCYYCDCMKVGIWYMVGS